MPEILIQTCPGQLEADERFVLVSIDYAAARVRRISEALSGVAIRALLEDRGEPLWCIAARIAIARTQMAHADCHESELAPLIPQRMARVPEHVTQARDDRTHRTAGR
jgi:hypothetical protein